MGDSECRREAILRIYEELNAGALREDGDVLEAVFLPDARHHRASHPLGDGPAGALQLYREVQTRLPGMVATVKRIVSDGPVVAVHWHAATDPRDEFAGESWCEFFRFDGDRVAERPHGADLAEVSAEDNRAIASAAFARFLDFDPTVVADHWGEVYLQHNEIIPDGAEAILHSLQEIGALPEEFRPRFTVLATAAEGDLVWFLERVRVGEATGFGVDIFRLDDRRIVEHWDIPAMKPGAVDVPA